MPSTSLNLQILRRTLRLQLIHNATIRRYSIPSSVIDTTNIPAPHRGTIKILSLNRPQARNALSRQLAAELSQEINAVASEPENGPTRALIIASKVDECFCAGADLKERAVFTQEETTQFLTSVRATFTQIQHLPIPTLSTVHAPALGGGLELALTTTLRLFTTNVEVGLPETRLAIFPGAGGTYRLPSVVGLQRARDLILTGRRVKAEEAYFFGLCDRLVEVPDAADGSGKLNAKELGVARERALEAGVQLASQICEGGPIAIRLALRAVNEWQHGLDGSVEGELYKGVVDTRDKHEALAAFREKRKPVFEGR